MKEMDGQMVLATVDCKTGKPRVTAPLKGQNIAEYHWVGPDQLLFKMFEDKAVESAATSGQATMLGKKTRKLYYMGHWLVDENMTKMYQIPTLEHVLVMVDPLPQDPTRVLLAEQWADKFYSPLYCFDPSQNKTKLLEPNPGNVVEWRTDTAGHVRAAIVAEPNQKHSFLYRETEQSPWQPLPLPGDAELITFDATGHHMLISFPNEDGRTVMQSYDLTARQLTGQPVASPIYDVDPVAMIDPRTGVARALSYDTDRKTFIGLDPDFEKIRKMLAPTFPGAVIYPIGLTASGDMILATYSDVSPKQYFAFNVQQGKLSVFLDQYPKVRDLILAPTKPITFSAADGTTLYGYLTLPLGVVAGKSPPLIALTHGGPSIRDTWGYNAEVQYFAALGYAVLQVNYRGSSGYGEAYALKSIIDVGRKSVDDVADGVRWAIAQGHADPKRIVICGGSYGGYIALGVATRHPSLPCCVVGFAGVYDCELDMKSDSKTFHELFRLSPDYWPDLKTNAAAYRAISPVQLAGEVKAPVLLLHGNSDRRVNVNQSELMARALRKAGKSVELVRDAEGVHGLFDEKLRLMYYERVTAFILRYAPPDKVL